MSPLTDDVAYRRLALHEAAHAVATILASRNLVGDDSGFLDLRITYPGEPPIDSENGELVYGRSRSLRHVTCQAEALALYHPKSPGRRRLKLRSEWTIAIALAGPYAHLKFMGLRSAYADEWTADLVAVAHSDLKMARQIFSRLKDADGSRRISWPGLHSQAQKLVADHWAAIEQLANQLMHLKQMTREQVVSAIDHLLPQAAPIFAPV